MCLSQLWWSSSGTRSVSLVHVVDHAVRPYPAPRTACVLIQRQSQTCLELQHLGIEVGSGHGLAHLSRRAWITKFRRTKVCSPTRMPRRCWDRRSRSGGRIWEEWRRQLKNQHAVQDVSINNRGEAHTEDSLVDLFKKKVVDHLALDRLAAAACQHQAGRYRSLVVVGDPLIAASVDGGQSGLDSIGPIE